jgi:outer membrane protein assembly factor BamE (lipoprotein component of BamABCDE complex)
MHAKTSLAALAMLGFLLSAAAVAGDATKPERSATQSIDPQTLENLKKGMSKSKVKSLLGEPWRTVQYNDLDDIENEFWEYRGKDDQGPFRVHIEFDKQGSVVLVAKIPERTSEAKGTPPKS